MQIMQPSQTSRTIRTSHASQHEPVEVRTDTLGDPLEFLWRGRLWQVRAIESHEVEHGPWWTTSAVRSLVAADGSSEDALAVAGEAPGGAVATLDALCERERWRVEAVLPPRPGRPQLRPGEPSEGHFDLLLTWRSGTWRLVARSPR